MNSQRQRRGPSISCFSLLCLGVSSGSCLCNITHTSKKHKKKNEFHLLPPLGILPHETFAVKSMDVNSNLLRLKLDMVYRDLAPEEGQKRFEEINTVPEAKPLAPVGTVEGPKKPKRKVVKAFIPKNK